MIIQGILDNSLNGQLCIRGFSNIKELARSSKADYTYQRNLIERTDITDFLETQEYLFFPEVILSYKIKHRFNPNKDVPLKAIQSGKNYKSVINEDQLYVKTISLKDGFSKDITVVTLVVSDSSDKPFHRIDGNHRLEAAEKSKSEKVERMVVPFCLLLGTEYYDEKTAQRVENQETEEFEKAVKIFFYNINTKTIPLTSEENLKVMIDDKHNFSNEDLANIFAGQYPIKTRELIDLADPKIFANIQHVLKENYRSFYNAVFKYLMDTGEDEATVVKKVLNSLQAVNTLYGSEPNLKSNNNIGILTGFLYYHVKEESAKFDLFKKWILNNQIFNVDNISAKSLIKIFDEIVASEIKVFVAMPYWDGNPGIVDDYNGIFKNVIEKIKQKYNFNISVYPIMQHKGATYDIIQDIINKIKSCKIFIADTTDNNPNVMYETGWARALDKEVILIRKKGSTPPKSDYQNDIYHDYDDNMRSTSLDGIIYDNIIAVLKNKFGLIGED